MGIDVTENKEVFFNGTHEKLVDTSPGRNPRCIYINQVPVSYIFRRLKSRTHPGDGNPLIYALKNIRGYSIEISEIKKLLPNFNEILNKTLDGCEYDLIIALPSNYNVGRILADRANGIIDNADIDHAFFVKKTVNDVLQEFNVSALPNKLRRDADSLRRDLRREKPGRLFSMKVVDKKLRKYIEPLRLTTDQVPDANKILLVDDIISSGSTITNAINLLRQINQEVSIEALCLLGRISNR